MSSRQLKLEASYDVEAGEATEDKFVMVVRRTNFYIQHNRKKFRSCDDDDYAMVMMCPTDDPDSKMRSVLKNVRHLFWLKKSYLGIRHDFFEPNFSHQKFQHCTQPSYYWHSYRF